MEAKEILMTNPEGSNEVTVKDPELMSVVEVLETMTPLELRAYKVKMLSGISDRESVVRMINDVLDGYGDI